MPDSLRLSPAQLDVLIEHARAQRPEEACGILAGKSDGTVTRVFPMENAEHSRTFFMMDSGEQFRVFDEMERENIELVAIFHSHPDTEAYPSARDLELAFYPDSVYLIVSLANEEPVSRAFKITDGKVRETEILIDEDAG